MYTVFLDHVTHSCVAYENITLMYAALYRASFLPTIDGNFLVNITDKIQAGRCVPPVNQSYIRCSASCDCMVPVGVDMFSCEDTATPDVSSILSMPLPGTLAISITDGQVSFDVSHAEAGRDPLALKVIYGGIAAGLGLLLIGGIFGIILCIKK